MDALHRLSDIWHTSRFTRPQVLAPITLTIAYAIGWCIKDYNAFLALGRGGVPYNVFGWAFITFWVRPFALTPSGAKKTKDYPAEGAHPNILALPHRKGDRAQLRGIAPHRQMSQYPPESMREPITSLFTSIVASNPQLLITKLSLYEKHNSAIFLHPDLLTQQSSSSPSPSIPETAIISRGEIAHVHPDLSIHLYLSPADARQAIEKGWAERHRLSVPRTSLVSNMYNVADTYLMVYGPRDKEELDIIRTILSAGVRFMSGGKEVKLPDLDG